MKTKLELIKNYPIEVLKNWGEYYGYPENICREMIDIVDCDWQNTKIGVLDDFGFQMVNYLMDVKKVSLQNIYFLVSEEDSVVFERINKWYSNFVENKIFSIYNINDMSFDLIIANPPYGSQNSLAKQILKENLDFAKKWVVLVPKNTFKDKLLWSKVEDVRLVDNCFVDAAVQNLAVAKLSKEANNVQDFERLKLNKRQCKYLDALYAYNKERVLGRALVKAAKVGNIEKKLSTRVKDVVLHYDEHLETIKDLTLKEAIDAKVAFVYTIWTPLDGVHTSQAHDWTYNLQDVWPDEWKCDCPVNIMLFATKLERDNFRDWWYSCLEREKEQKLRSGLTNFILDILRDARSSGGGGYDVYFPNLDWSHPWTDQEILAELGLPEDFLEREDEVVK